MLREWRRKWRERKRDKHVCRIINSMGHLTPDELQDMANYAKQDKPRRRPVWRPQRLIINLLLVVGFLYLCYMAATDLLPAAIDVELNRMPTSEARPPAAVLEGPVLAAVDAGPEAMTMVATAYSWGCGTGDNLTASMTPIREGVIAVDPAIIPLGSQVEIIGLGTFQAEDVGGTIRGNMVDIFMDNHQACLEWGRREVEVRLLQ